MPQVSSPVFDGKRTIPSPEVSQIMADALHLLPADKLMEIGTGSGTQTALWAATGCEVHSVELEPWLSEITMDGFTNVYLHSGDGVLGLLSEGPFTAIVATCGVEEIPDAWVKQLSEGGKLVAPVGDAKSQKLTIFLKVKGDLRPQFVLAYCRFQMLKQRPKPGKLRYEVKQ